MTLLNGLKQICAADKTAALLLDPRLDIIAGLLERYMDEIERFNPSYGLIKIDNESGRTARDTLIIKHILDSLAPLGHLASLLWKEKPFSQGSGFPGKSLADVVSGAGLPGIPLAICLPDVQITLIERMGRRAGFLRNVLAVLGLSHVTVEETELEKTAGCFDLVSFRALSPLNPAFVSSLVRLLRPWDSDAGGVVAAYKGRRETTEAELAGLADLQNIRAELVPLSVPFLDEERCLVLLSSLA